MSVKGFELSSVMTIFVVMEQDDDNSGDDRAGKKASSGALEYKPYQPNHTPYK